MTPPFTAAAEYAETDSLSEIGNGDDSSNLNTVPGLAEAPVTFIGPDGPDLFRMRTTVSDLEQLSPEPLRIDRSLVRAPFGDRPRTVKVRLNRAGSADLIVPDISRIPRPLRDKSLKKIIDFALAAVGLALASPFLLLITALLWLDGGSPFFLQSRVGKDRTRFPCLKFRTMRVDAEARLKTLLCSDPNARKEWQKHQKLENDPRITPFGRWLRAYSLDELPQLINVLRGEMSLVGPRPIIAPEVPGYDSDRAYYTSDAFSDYAGCTPGITGLWQIAGRHQTAHSERVRLDGWYSRNWSIILDLKILLRTVRVVLGRTGG